MIRWLFLLLGDFESGLERLLIFPSALLFVLLHLLLCAEDAIYIGTHGLEFFVIILEIMVSIVLGVLLNPLLPEKAKMVLERSAGRRCCEWTAGIMSAAM